MFVLQWLQLRRMELAFNNLENKEGVKCQPAGKFWFMVTCYKGFDFTL